MPVIVSQQDGPASVRVDCSVPAPCGILPAFPCLPFGLAGIDVTPRRTDTNTLDGHLSPARRPRRPGDLKRAKAALIKLEFSIARALHWYQVDVLLHGSAPLHHLLSGAATPAHPCPTLYRVSPVSPAVVSFSFSPSLARKDHGPAGPTAGRSTHGALVLSAGRK